MLRKRYTIVFLMLFASSIFLSSFISVHGWSKPVLIVPGSTEAPIIDGIKDDLWTGNSVNVTRHQFTSRSSPITLYATTYGGFIYFFIEAEFTSLENNESISLYLGSTNQTTTNASVFMDKKMVTMVNITQYGNHTSFPTDFNLRDGNYSVDDVTDAYNGKAGFASTAGTYRNYEFAIPLTAPVNSTNDVTWYMGRNYAFKVGINNTDSDEEVSEVFLIQIGQRLGLSEEEIGEYKFDTELYLKIVMIIVLILWGFIGAVVLISKKNIEPMTGGMVRLQEERANLAKGDVKTKKSDEEVEMDEEETETAEDEE